MDKLERPFLQSHLEYLNFDFAEMFIEKSFIFYLTLFTLLNSNKLLSGYHNKDEFRN